LNYINMKKLKYIGALTDKLYSFKSRNWELDINNTIDIFDSLGSNINVYIYGSEIKRILKIEFQIKQDIFLKV